MLRILMILLISSSLISSFTRSKGEGCIEGEVWYQDCRKCVCLEDGEISCESVRECLRSECDMNVKTFGETRRCHCVGETSVCVDLEFQKGLEGKPCSRDFYVYDTCTFCKCDTSSNVTRCFAADCSILHGGFCNVGSVIVENMCYECTCTFTKFRKCFPRKKCLQKISKPGTCPRIHHSFPESFRKFCYSRTFQGCYTDFACPGKKKCCPVTDCFFKCVIPSRNTLS